MKKLFTAALAALTLALNVTSYAQEQAEYDIPESATPVTDVMYDALLMRPVGVIALGVGAVTFIISLPITLPLGEAGRTARELVAAPFNYTFTRPIGDMWTDELQRWEQERRIMESEGRSRAPKPFRGRDD